MIASSRVVGFFLHLLLAVRRSAVLPRVQSVVPHLSRRLVLRGLYQHNVLVWVLVVRVSGFACDRWASQHPSPAVGTR